MSALLAEPVVHEEVKAAAFSIAEPELPTSPVPDKKEFQPLLLVFVACFVAFHLAAAMIGTLTAWIYQLRHSGAFAS